MPLSGTFVLQVYYSDLDSTFGCYVCDPESGPFIVLREGLDSVTGGVVYRHLMAYHEKIPPDSPYRLFMHVVCFEDLVPPEAIPRNLPDVIIFARASRQWSYPVPYPVDYRLIGREFNN